MKSMDLFMKSCEVNDVFPVFPISDAKKALK